ncbi:MAG: biotin/lipoyl-binding protein [Methylobacter tundripaludum]|nr:biotin/lipoyl-binding protein [Methylobacter tundripaludum]
MNFRNFCRYLVGSCRLAIHSQLRILAKITSAYGYRVLLGNDESRTHLAPTCYVIAIKLRDTRVSKFPRGDSDDEAPASRDGKLELPALNSQAGAWELAPITFTHRSQALRGNDELVIADPILAAINPLIGLLLLILAGCSHQDQDRQTLRPVNVIRITSQQTQNDRPFPGEVRARFETTLSFRVTGKLISRSVDMGDRVRKGQMLARLDPSDYRLASQSIKAQLIAAKADRKYS